jgi:hypothetical protein
LSATPRILFDDPQAEPDVRLIVPSFFDANALREGPRKLYRYERGGDRYYAVMQPAVTLFPSVTTVIKRTTPMPPPLLKWISDYGQRKAEQIRDERAAYGTLMHILFGELAINKEFDLDSLVGRVNAHAAKMHLNIDAKDWAEDLAADLYGFSDFLTSREVEVLGVEVALASEKLGYAGCLDLVCRMKIWVGKWVTKLCYLDWKSNRNQFFEESIIQGHAYAPLWNEAFPEFPIECVCLYGAKRWDETTKDRFRFKDVTDEQVGTLFPNLLEQFRLRQGPRDNRLTFGGTLKVGSDNKACLTSETIEMRIARTGGPER